MSLSTDIVQFLDGRRPTAPLLVRAASGASIGSVFVVFVPLLLGLWFVGGPEHVSRGTRIRVDLLSLLYPLATTVSGALLFALAPLGRWRPLGAVLGVLAVLPGAAALVFCFERAHLAWQSSHTVLTVVMASSFGLPLGWSLSSFTRGRRSTRRTDRAAM